MKDSINVLPAKTSFGFTDEDTIRGIFDKASKEFPSALDDRESFLGKMGNIYDSYRALSATKPASNATTDSGSVALNVEKDTCSNVIIKEEEEDVRTTTAAIKTPKRKKRNAATVDSESMTILV